MIEKSDILIVIPFFNEEQRLPEILTSIAVSAKNKYRAHLVMVNHRSTDTSEKVINKFAGDFYKVTIVKENFPIPCGGQPRSTGIKEAIKLAESYYHDNSIPIATLDADVIVSKKFIPEIINKLQEGFDIISFCERYNSAELLNFVNKQNNKELCLNSFVGLNWLRYQILWGLINVGIKETRGPGGYAMKARILKLLDHKQPFDKDGKPITGENNRLGIIAFRKNLKVYSSPYYSLVHPRREIVSCTNISQKGYSKNAENAEVFKLAREVEDYPVLTDEQFNNYLTNGIKRAIRMVIIRAVAYGKLSSILAWFDHPVWQQIVESAQNYVDQNKPSNEVLEVIGNGFYNDLFQTVLGQLTDKDLAELSRYLEQKIPDSEILINWINDQSLIIKPDQNFIKI